MCSPILGNVPHTSEPCSFNAQQGAACCAWSRAAAVMNPSIQVGPCVSLLICFLRMQNPPLPNKTRVLLTPCVTMWLCSTRWTTWNNSPISSSKAWTASGHLLQTRVLKLPNGRRPHLCEASGHLQTKASLDSKRGVGVGREAVKEKGKARQRKRKSARFQSRAFLPVCARHLWHSGSMVCRDQSIPQNQGAALEMIQGLAGRKDCAAACHADAKCNALAWGRASSASLASGGCWLKTSYSHGTWYSNVPDWDFCYKVSKGMCYARRV